jgi:hypothetical protein
VIDLVKQRNEADAASEGKAKDEHDRGV